MKIVRLGIVSMVGFACAPFAMADTIAITEFMNAPAGLDSTREWAELFNYGASSVTLTGWEFRDEDSDVDNIPTMTIPSGGFAILAKDKAVFEDEWLGGVADARVFQMVLPTFTFANSADEAYLCSGPCPGVEDGIDTTTNVVWNLAYDDDETGSESTYLAVDSFAITDFGNKGAAGIVRNGDDLSIGGFLGYEQDVHTADPFAYTSTEPSSDPGTGTNVGSPLLGDYTAVPEPGTLVLVGIGVAVVARRRR